MLLFVSLMLNKVLGVDFIDIIAGGVGGVGRTSGISIVILTPVKAESILKLQT